MQASICRWETNSVDLGKVLASNIWARPHNICIIFASTQITVHIKFKATQSIHFLISCNTVIHGSTVSCLEFCDYIPLLYLVLLHAVVVLLLMFLFANRRNASKQKNSTWAEAYFMILHAWLLHQRLVLEGSKAGISITCSTITQAMADSRPFLFSLFDTMITYLPMLWWWLLQSSPPMSARCTGSGSGLGP